MRRIDTNTRVCAVIGDPVEHSLSPLMHNAAFQAAQLNYVYVAFRVENVGGFAAGLRAMPSFRGVSVTIPHKMAVMEHLDEIEPMARHIGSVNTVTNHDGRLVGSTTDGPGALRAFDEAGVSLDGRRVLFVGSGGAVRAVAFAVAALTRVDAVCILGRTPNRVAAIVNDLRAKTAVTVTSGRLADGLPQAMASHDVVIHGTPVGMYPKAGETCVPADMFRPEQVVFDMVYRPYKTRLVREAETAGCTTIVGVEMLINQAVLQFETWTGAAAPTDVMREAVMAELGAK